MRNQIFFSYRRRDKKWLEEIIEGLQPYLRQKPLLLWDESKIQGGQDWRQEINHALASAKVAVLLVSRAYLASDFIAKDILPPLLAAAENEGLTILWIHVRKCAYKETEIERYQAVYDPSRPLAALEGNERDEALVSICQQIAEAANKGTEERESEEASRTVVRLVDVPGINIKGEHIANRTKIQQIIEDHFDVGACFIRQRELNDLFEGVLDGSCRILQGIQGAGKTALLKQLQKRCHEKKISARYIDFSQPEEQLATTLWRNVVLALTNVDYGFFSSHKVDHYLDTDHLEPHAVICLDNLDALASNPNISLEREMAHLRTLVYQLGADHKSAFSVILTIREDFNVHAYASSVGSPWYTIFTLLLERLSEERSIELLHHADITDTKQIAFCVNKSRYRLPLDLLLLAYLVKEYTPSNHVEYELIEKMYLKVEPLLRY